MDTYLPYIFLRSLVLLPVRILIVLTVMAVCMVVPLVLGGEVEESKMVIQAMFQLPYVVFCTLLLSSWWSLVAYILMSYAVLRGYLYVYNEYCWIELLRVGLSSFLMTVWVIGEWWLVVALVGIFDLIATHVLVRKLLFSRKIEHKVARGEAWVENHIAAKEGERLELNEIDSEAFKIWLIEAGWVEENVAWKPSSHYRRWLREGLELTFSETDEAPEYVSGVQSIIDELTGVLDLLKETRG